MEKISESQEDLATIYHDSVIFESSITKINGFPAHRIVYTEGIVGESESKEDANRTITYIIIAYDRV